MFESKKDLVENLDYYGCNRVKYFTVKDLYDLSNQEIVRVDKFAMRSLDNGNNVFTRNVKLIELMILDRSFSLEEKNVIICEDYQDYDNNNRICCGEVEIYKDEFNVWAYRGFLNYSKEISVREASKENFINITNRHQIPQKVFNFMWSKGIVNKVVEFSLYNIPLGIKNDELIIWEIRRY